MTTRRTLLDEIARTEAELAGLASARERLEARIDQLRREVVATEGAATELAAEPVNSAGTTATLAAPTTAADKVNLFRSLFRGRQEVFARLWINPSKGTRGYAPACANEWVRGVCEKPRVKCGECPNQAFESVDDRVIHDHLRGRHVVGVYPLLQDETCWFLAVDFDKTGWKEDVAAFTQTCTAFGLPVAVERSRSGNGAHAWFFFAAPVAATLARRMGCYLLTETMARRHELSMSSYDRLFPNQDTLPRGGFGNLIALPLQYEAREAGNTVFIDECWQAHSDQWAFLAGHPRLDAARVRELAREASDNGKVVGLSRGEPVADENAAPWLRSPSRNVATTRITEPLPVRVLAVISQQIFVEKEGLPSSLLNQVKRLAAFQNPEFYKKQAMRLSTALTPRVISCAEDLPDHIGLPRGCLDDLRELLRDNSVTLVLEDRRHAGEPYDVSFRGELSKAQERAVRAMLAHDGGVFVAPPASGKTVVGIKLIAARGRNTLVLVHRAQLLDQWRARLSMFLDLDPKEIGQIGAGKRKVTGKIDVAMIQSLARRDGADDLVANYGHVIVDECHHVPAVSFERVMREVRARFVTGLTATPQRRDGHEPILELQLGPVRTSIDPRSDTARHAFDHRVVVRETSFRLNEVEGDERIQDVYRKLAVVEVRNDLIIDDVIRTLDEGRTTVLLTDRRDHLERLAARHRELTPHVIVLQGGMGTKARRTAVESLAAIPNAESRVIIATGRFIGEGFDDARLDTLFLAMPVSWKGTLVQYAGRLHRAHQGKSEVRIYDYVDREVPMLARMFEKRLKGYRAMGYEAVPSSDRTNRVPQRRIALLPQSGRRESPRQ